LALDKRGFFGPKREFVLPAGLGIRILVFLEERREEFEDARGFDSDELLLPPPGGLKGFRSPPPPFSILGDVKVY